jgi:hypothetical protein
MPLGDAVISILGRKGFSTAMEIRDCMKEKGSDVTVSKQA